MSTITDNDRRIQYATSGGESSFGYDFQIDDADHIEVYRDGVLQTRGTHYSVTGVGSSGGGTVVPDSSLTIASGETWTIQGATPEDRSNDYSGFATVKPATVDADLDRIIFMLQQLRRDSNRAIRIDIEETTDEEALRLPGSAARASKTLGFDANGDIAVIDSFSNGASTPGDIAADVNDLDVPRWDSAQGKFINKPTFRSSLSALQQIDTSRLDDGDTVDTRGRVDIGDGGEGTHAWRTGDFTTKVSNDEVNTGQGDGGIYVSSQTDVDAGTPGASGAWVRQHGANIYANGIGPLLSSWYGVTADGSTDDEPAINQAIDSAKAFGGNRVILPAGTCVVGATIGRTASDTEYFGLQIEGEGELTTTIKGDHTSGAVIAFNRSNCVLKDLTIDASSTRQAGSATGNHGVLMEAPDSAGKAVASMVLENVRVKNQPGSGFVHIGLAQLSSYYKCNADSNSEHGYRFDRGTLTSRTNKTDPGLVTLYTCWANGNGGHGVVAGNPNDTAGSGSLRLLFLNWESADNASDGTVRFEDSCDWVRGENITFVTSALGYSSDVGRGALTFQGNDLRIVNTRIIDCTYTVKAKPDTVSDATIGIDADVRISNKSQDPAIVITDTSKVNAIRLRSDVLGNVTSAFTSGAIAAIYEGGGPQEIIAVTTTGQTVNNSTTLVDSAELQLALDANETVVFEAILRYSGGSSSDFKVGIGSPSGTTIRWSAAGGVHIGAGDSAIVDTTESTESSEMTFGASSPGRRAHISGRATAGSTAGNLSIQFAQNSAVSENTQLLEGSYLRIIRGQS